MFNEKFLTLGDKQTKLFEAVDLIFKNWAVEEHASQITPPMLLTIEQLNTLEVLTNFPHETILAASIDLKNWRTPDKDLIRISNTILNNAEYVIPKAACYAAYLSYQNSVIQEPGLIITLKGQCCRHEQHYQPHSRFMGFNMREIILLGTREFVLEKLNYFEQKILSFTTKLDLPIISKTATDPFYDTQATKKLLQQVSNSKIEFCYNDLALASKNYHRNFFGERCQIKNIAGEYIFSGCIAFGLERWLFVLFHHFKNWDDALLNVKP
jgi:hypothetical protein